MRFHRVVAAIGLVVLGAGYLTAQETGRSMVRGWLSDEKCARGRAEAGVYSGTNPRCAKECVAKGRKVVLINEEQKTIVEIANQSAAKGHVGDYVEISGSFSGTALHIDALNVVKKGVAECARKPLQRQ